MTRSMSNAMNAWLLRNLEQAGGAHPAAQHAVEQPVRRHHRHDHQRDLNQRVGVVQHAAQSVASYGHDARPARRGGRMGRWQDECVHSTDFMISKVK